MHTFGVHGLAQLISWTASQLSAAAVRIIEPIFPRIKIKKYFVKLIKNLILNKLKIS